MSVSVNGNVENNIIFVENFNQNLLKSMILVRGKVCCAEKVKKNIFFDPLPENIFRSESPLRVRSSAHTSQWSANSQRTVREVEAEAGLPTPLLAVQM